jgi:hypothetical protein
VRGPCIIPVAAPPLHRGKPANKRSQESIDKKDVTAAQYRMAAYAVIVQMGHSCCLHCNNAGRQVIDTQQGDHQLLVTRTDSTADALRGPFMSQIGSGAVSSWRWQTSASTPCGCQAVSEGCPAVRFNCPNSFPHCLHLPPVAIFIPHACRATQQYDCPTVCGYSMYIYTGTKRRLLLQALQPPNAPCIV